MIGSLSELAQILGNSEIVAEIAKDILEVEEELIRQSASEVKLVEQVARHTLRSGGKRLRPACVALAARATGLHYDSKRVHRLGACLEMVHMATLIHDDIIDRSPIRRGMPTASAVFGNTGSILSGDVLLAKSMVILAEDGDLGIIRNVAQAVVEMAEGEVREVETRGDFDLSEDDHIEILHKKTAAFIESCCFVGATLTGAPEPVVIALKKFGAAIGLAFQIVDDLLDYRGVQKDTGKANATDFREGCATLPLIYLRAKLTDPEREVCRLRFGHGIDDDELAMITEWMESRGAFKEAEAKAHSLVEEALGLLEILPGSEARQMLENLARFVISRTG